MHCSVDPDRRFTAADASAAIEIHIMTSINALYLEDLCSGRHRMVEYLARKAIPISRDRVRNLLQCVVGYATYRETRTTVRGEQSNLLSF